MSERGRVLSISIDFFTLKRENSNQQCCQNKCLMEHKVVIFSIVRRAISRDEMGTISTDRHTLRNIKM